MPKALRRPRGLPPPPPGRRLTHLLGDGLTRYQTAATAGLEPICRPSPSITDPLARDLIRACPLPSGPSLSCPQTSKIDP